MIPPDIFFFAIGAFLLGILSASFGWHFYFTVLALTGVGLVALRFVRAAPLPLFLALFVAAGFFGSFYYRFFVNLHELHGVAFGEPLIVQGVVIREPDLYETTAILEVSLSPPLRGKVRVIASRAEFVRYADILTLTGTIKKEGLPARPTMAFPEISVTGHSREHWFKERLLGFKETLIAQFRKFLSQDEAALAAGLTLGAKGDFRREFKAQMAASGTTHIVALSGYNIAILAIAVAAALEKYMKRRTVFFITALLIALFVLMVGGEASVVRAAIMGFLALGVVELGRIYHPRNAIAFTAVLMVLADPTVLVFNIGFILSFASLLGIIYLEPALAKRFSPGAREGGFLGWRKVFTTTAAAQLAVMPILIQKFGSFSLSAFLANTLILPFVPLTMFFGFAFIGLTLFSPSLGFFSGWIVKMFLDYEIGLIKIFSYVRTPAPGMFGSVSFAVAFYVLLIVIILHHHLYAREEK